jgi:hypothetical protein
VNDIRHNQRQGLRRYRVESDRTCTFDLISFDDLRVRDYTARIRDISPTGVGLLTEQLIEPGIIWFKNPVYGKKSGVLVWCKPEEPWCRAGIQFFAVPPAAEAYVQRQIVTAKPFQPLRDPEQIITHLISSVKPIPGSSS